jgi:starvation-inducible DNA-binding protein
MIRSLFWICVLVGAALTVAAGSDTPAPGPQNEEGNLRAQDTAQEPAPRAKQDQTHEESNETTPQPKRIEYSYPLKGDPERRKSVKGLQ